MKVCDLGIKAKVRYGTEGCTTYPRTAVRYVDLGIKAKVRYGRMHEPRIYAQQKFTFPVKSLLQYSTYGFPLKADEKDASDEEGACGCLLRTALRLYLLFLRASLIVSSRLPCFFFVTSHTHRAIVACLAGGCPVLTLESKGAPRRSREKKRWVFTHARALSASFAQVVSSAAHTYPEPLATGCACLAQLSTPNAPITTG